MVKLARPVGLEQEVLVFYDTLIESISLVENYCSQFGGIVKTSSYDDLVKRPRAPRRAGVSTVASIREMC
jgi:hypothetical protein